jgi:hypothetical protein
VYHRNENEIVVDTAAGGRNTFNNCRTMRNGAELSAARTLETLDSGRAGFIDARYQDGFTSGTPPVR